MSWYHIGPPSVCLYDPRALSYLEEGMRGNLEGQSQQIFVDVLVPSDVLQGQALLAGSPSVGGEASQCC